MVFHENINAEGLIDDFVPSSDSKDSRPFYLRESFPWTADYANKRNYVKELLHICNQSQIQRWRKIKKMLDVSKAKKIAEGVYSEIFVAQYKMETLIPIGDNKPINRRRTNSFREGTAKLVVLKELTNLSQVEQGYSTEGFVQLKGALVVKGRYPSMMINAWKQYKGKKKSNKANPALFSANQNFLLLSVENGGISLKEYEITTVLQAYSIVYQLFMATAVAEFRLSFEHRDLNCEKILITGTDWHDMIRFHFQNEKSKFDMIVEASLTVLMSTYTHTVPESKL
uniref:Protein kinase domain-containing protein n=1 Tax=Loa loa TaxID=7209 RepID=A0A1I7VI22_LOALO